MLQKHKNKCVDTVIIVCYIWLTKETKYYIQGVDNMTNTSEVKRGEIWWADLGRLVGSEQGGVRPIVVIQNDVGNKYSPTVICAPITSKMKRKLPTHVDVTKRNCGLPWDSTVLLEQIRVIDKSRLHEKAGDIDMDMVDRAVLISLGLPLGNCAQKAMYS